MGKHKLQRNSARWNTLASAYVGGDIHRLKCTDADLARPDQIKFQYCTYITDFEPDKSKAYRMERGPLHEIPDIRHWALEEYFWHGVPGDDWDPLEAYLEFVGDRLSETGKAQLRQWKQARVSAYRIGSVQGDTMLLEEWDIEQGVVIGEPFRAISLGMGGVQPFRDLRGDIHIGYIAPWKPAESLYCSMGYCVMPKIKEAEAFELLLNLHLPALVVKPLPWKTTSVAQQRYLREWHQRDWNAWLADRLQFPFRALTAHPITKKLVPVKLTALLYSNPGIGRDLGVYMAMSGLLGFAATGVANVLPVDLASPNWMPIAEYREYRRLVGAPPKAPGGTFKTIWIDR